MSTPKKTNTINNNEASTSINIPVFNIREEMKNSKDIRNNNPKDNNRSNNNKPNNNKSNNSNSNNNNLNDNKLNHCNNGVNYDEQFNDYYYQQILKTQYMDSQQAQHLIDNINNDIDLSNVTLAEDENTKINDKEKSNNRNIKEKRRSKRKKPFLQSRCCCCCCKWCTGLTCALFIILLLCILGLVGYFLYPRTPTFTVKEVKLHNVTEIVNTLQAYYEYHTEIQNYINYQNLDLSFDFDVTLEIKSSNYYNLNFTNVQIDIIYPGTFQTPRFQVAKSNQDFLSIKGRSPFLINFPFTANISFRDMLEKGYFYNVFSSCTWDIHFMGFIKFLRIKNKWFVIDRNMRFTRTCIIEEILTKLQQQLP
ncbi:hypothetical protein H8356DRAFT_1430613 [Neocallimastix lanati (nom. inval.)]|jgi:hypothetical protein|nr:hypothetical protein H8356DRAFT_1430613 [Neocallimastix sp. JGI-2020a]